MLKTFYYQLCKMKDLIVSSRVNKRKVIYVLEPSEVLLKIIEKKTKYPQPSSVMVHGQTCHRLFLCEMYIVYCHV